MKDKDRLLVKVRTSKTGQKTITIPQSYPIQGDEWVEVSKVKIKKK